eukprot:scaffold103810_cov19-Prasinocladus_malaysianus.AAC.1
MTCVADDDPQDSMFVSKMQLPAQKPEINRQRFAHKSYVKVTKRPVSPTSNYRSSGSAQIRHRG